MGFPKKLLALVRTIHELSYLLLFKQFLKCFMPYSL